MYPTVAMATQLGMMAALSASAIQVTFFLMYDYVLLVLVAPAGSATQCPQYRCRLCAQGNVIDPKTGCVGCQCAPPPAGSIFDKEKRLFYYFPY